MPTSSHRRESNQYHRNFMDVTTSITTSETFSIPEECEDGYSDEDTMTVLQISKPLQVYLPPLREIRFEDIDYKVYEKSYLRPTRCFLAKKRTKSDFDLRSDSIDWVKFPLGNDSLDYALCNNDEVITHDDNHQNLNLDFKERHTFHVEKDVNCENGELSEKFKRNNHQKSYSEDFTFKNYESFLNRSQDSTIKNIGKEEKNAQSSLNSISSDTTQFYEENNLSTNDEVIPDKAEIKVKKLKDKMEEKKANHVSKHNRKCHSIAADSARDIHVPMMSPRRNISKKNVNEKNVEVDDSLLRSVRDWIRNCNSPVHKLSLESCIIQESVLSSMKAEADFQNQNNAKFMSNSNSLNDIQQLVEEHEQDEKISLSSFEKQSEYSFNSQAPTTIMKYEPKSIKREEMEKMSDEEMDFDLESTVNYENADCGVNRKGKKEYSDFSLLVQGFSNVLSFAAGVGAASVYHLIKQQMLELEKGNNTDNSKK